MGRPAMSSDKVPVTALSRGPCSDPPELAARYLEEYAHKIRLAVEPLEESAVWRRPSENLGAVGNLILHIRGNLSLWVLRSLGGAPFERRRAEEFATRETHGKEELLALLEEAVAGCCRVLRDLDRSRLTEPVSIQGYETDRLGALFHAVEHMSYHTGQIVGRAKQLLAGRESFEFYPRHQGE
jgi:uncharacterized damage-inducible protein DinB